MMYKDSHAKIRNVLFIFFYLHVNAIKNPKSFDSRKILVDFEKLNSRVNRAISETILLLFVKKRLVSYPIFLASSLSNSYSDTRLATNSKFLVDRKC